MYHFFASKCPTRLLSLGGLPTAVALSTVLAAGAVQAAPYDGLSAATAGLSAAQILRDHAASPTGVYWIDPDSAGAAPARQVFADMSTAGGGWMLVRHAAGTGNWIAVTDSLTGSAVLNPHLATDPLATLDWAVPFSNSGGNFLFKTGNNSTWGVLASADVYQHVAGDNFLPNSTVIASFNTAVGAGGQTNVLNRNGTGTGSFEDPWIGFEGGHIANIGKMMYGENGFGGAHTVFKNANLGVNVFVREGVVPALPVPEPATWAMWALGLACTVAAAGRKRA